MAGIPLTHAYVGISGSHIRTCTSQGMVAIKNGEITERDITNVMHAAQAITLPEGQQLIHAVPHSFIVNGVDIVQNPRGMFGVRLEVRVHIITGAIASVHNLIKCCELAGVQVQDIVLEPLASADAVLSKDERTLGVGLLDIGGGTSDFALYQRGSICHTTIIPLAGNIFTSDIAICLRTSLNDAERIKRAYGIADTRLLATNNTIEVLSTDGSEQTVISSHDLTAVLSSRAEELLSFIAAEIERHQLRSFMHAGLVITGGGALLVGLKEQASSVLRMPVRIGKPQLAHATSLLLEHPMYATAYGLLIHAQKKRAEHLLNGEHHPLLHRIMGRMKSWICDMF